MQTVKVYRGRPRIRDILEVYKSKHSESICYLRRPHVQHWAFAGLAHKFLVCTRNAWDLHPVNVTHIGVIETNYDTLAEYDRGALVLEHRNTLATLFHVDPVHPETAVVVHNFIQHFLTILSVKKTRGMIPE